MDIKKTVEELLYYAKTKLGLDSRDENFARNFLMEKFKLNDRYFGEIDCAEIDQTNRPDNLIEKITNYALENGLINKGSEQKFTAEILGYLSPLPSKTEKVFYEKYAQNKEDAFKYLYDLSVSNDYVILRAVGKNEYWRAAFSDGRFIEITVNLSKPEKKNADIAKAQKDLTVSYPKCALCAENEGYYGASNKPPRENLRTVQLKLNGEDWFMQYSPYQYYNEHVIVINKEHKPMKVDESTYVKLFDFVDFYPEYFVGSNAMLPIVGGSILNHEHYQGGGHLMPLHHALNKYRFYLKAFPSCEISILDWYNSVIKITDKDRRIVENVGALILNKFLDYSDESVDLIAETNSRHNAITPITLKRGDTYRLDLILRNNRASEQYPDGIFHAHKEYQNIKSEGIGLIEAMGLFILPGRLKAETAEIEKYLLREIPYNGELPENLVKHKAMIETLLMERYADKLAADEAIKRYINEVCRNILRNTAVFKEDEEGNSAFLRFMEHCGFTKI